MSPATVAIVVAVLSAVLALFSAIGVEVLRRRGAASSRSSSANWPSSGPRTTGTPDRELVRAYRNPLLRAAYDLQSRIWNVHGGFRGRGDTEQDYVVTNTLYVLAEFFGWLEIVRRELQFLDLVDSRRQTHSRPTSTRSGHVRVDLAAAPRRLLHLAASNGRSAS